VRVKKSQFKLGIVDRGFLLVFIVFGLLGLFFWGREAITNFITHRADEVVEMIEAAKASLRFSQPLAYQSGFSAMSDECRFQRLAGTLGASSKRAFLRNHLLFGGRKLLVNDFFHEAHIY
jgi:hypothetical protein